jgi:prepilin-type N-terminal cleavage/methylation domain-containing protein
MPADRRGFTLIELLVVIAIILVLTGIAFPLLNIARNFAQDANTRSLLHRVEGALGAFRIEAGGYPFHAWDASIRPPPAEDTDPPTNQLAYHLCRDQDTAARADLHADMDAAATAAEAMLKSGMLANMTGAPATFTINDWTIRDLNVRVTYIDSGNILQSPYYHLAAEARRWARAQVLVGNVGACRTSGTSATVWTAQAGLPLIPAASRKSKGFSCDYLSREIPARLLQGDAICDDRGRPIVYLCPVQPGAKDAFHENQPKPNQSVEVTAYGGSSLVGNFTGMAFFGLNRSGRQVTTVLASDRRVWAPERLAFSYELWSRGRDGQISSLRTGLGNRDNVGAENYDKALQ